MCLKRDSQPSPKLIRNKKTNLTNKSFHCSPYVSRERFAATPVDQLVKGSICPAWWEDKLSRHIGNIGHIGHIGYICLTFVRCVISNMPGLVRKHTVQCLLILGWHVGIGHTVGTGVAEKIVQWTTPPFLTMLTYTWVTHWETVT